MYSCLVHRNSQTLLERYTRELILVARHGDPAERDLFLRRYDPCLGGIGRWVTALGTEEQSAVLRDALRCQRGAWPRTTTGMRLALPRGFRGRVHDPWEGWRMLADFKPQGIALDPVCLMLLDPASVEHTSSAGKTTAFFCCPDCKAAYDGDPAPAALSRAA
jgi:YHS domain-containing protein